MHRPDLAGEIEPLAFVAITRRMQVSIEPDKVEGRADPGDAGNQVHPAAEKVKPLEKIGIHWVSCRRRWTRTEALPAALKRVGGRFGRSRHQPPH